MDSDTIKVLKKVVTDLLCLFIVGFPILLFYLFGKPYQRGFFCDDDSIRYPFKESTISNRLLYIVGLFFPITIMILIELLRWHRGDDDNKVRVTLFGKHIPSWITNCYKTIGTFGFGAACSQLLTDIGKYSIGRMRPHFLQVCVPNVDCASIRYQQQYIEDFTCTESNSRLIREARLSFPSGHSSFSAYTMIYLVIYLQCRFKWKGSFLLKHVVQFCCLAMTWGTALSRVSDYKHHWSDVLVGLIIGIAVAIINATFISDLFKSQVSGRSLHEIINLGSTSQPLNAKRDVTIDL